MTNEYKAYLKSKEWKAIKAKVISIRGNYCERCKEQRQVNILHLHHKTYKRIFNEALSDLELLCPGCHMAEHKINPNKKDSKKPAVKVKPEKQKFEQYPKLTKVQIVEKRIREGYYKTEHGKLNAMTIAYKQDRKNKKK